MGRLRRAIAGSAVASLAMAAMVGPVHAESVLWTLVASPLAATTGVETTFTLTATNEDPLASLLSDHEIGCVVVDVPANFVVAAATVTGSSAGGSWGASLGANRVTVRAGSGGDRLELLDWVRFTVRATPHTAASLAWDSRAYRAQDCSGGGALLGVPPVVVVSGLTVTPTPVPTLPLASATPLPTLPPLPTLQPTQRPTATIGPTAPATPRPSAPEATPDQTRPANSSTVPDPTGSAADPRGDVSDTPAAPGSGGDGPGGTAGSGTGGSGEPLLRLDPALLFGAGSYEWAIPTVAVAVPGLLVIAWVAAQTGAALVWVPAVRRLREERRRRLRVGALDAPPGH